MIMILALLVFASPICYILKRPLLGRDILSNEMLNLRIHQFYQQSSQPTHFISNEYVKHIEQNQVIFNSSSHAKPQMTQPNAHHFFQAPNDPDAMQEVSYPSVINQLQSQGTSLNNDTYSGFFSGSSLSQSEEQESQLLTREELKMIKRQKISCSRSSCSICFDEYKKGDVIRNLPCGHKFHYKCMKPWFKTSSLCPLCRFDLKTHCAQKVLETKLTGNSNISPTTSHVQDQIEHSQFGLINPEVHAFVKPQNKNQASNTFIEFDSLSMGSSLQNELNAETNLRYGQRRTEGSVFDGNNQIKDEVELRRRILGFEAQDNLSFFEKKEEEKDIKFGIEDDISEIGF